MADETKSPIEEARPELVEADKKVSEQSRAGDIPGKAPDGLTTDEAARSDKSQTAEKTIKHSNVIDLSSTAIDKIIAGKTGTIQAVGRKPVTTEKSEDGANVEDTRQEWDKSLADVEVQKQAEKNQSRPPKEVKTKPDKTKALPPLKKAVKTTEQTTAPKTKGSKAPKSTEKTAPPADEANMVEKKQKLEQELREKYGIPKTDKPVEPWVAPEVETVVRIPHEKLHAFKDHPFNVEKNTKFMAFVASIRAQGVTQPVIVRPDGKDGYEIISGHRRDAGSIEAEIPFTPCIVRALNDDQAIQQMVEDNVNNREVSTMELARALKMQLESIKHQGAREALDGKDFTADVDKRSNEVIAVRNGMSVKQVQRHIALTRLVQPLQDLVDGKVMGGDGKPLKIAFTPAVELSGIKPENQNYIALAIEAQQATPSLSQSQRMRELDKAGKLNGDVIDGIMCEEKKEVDKVIISGAELSNYFGKEKTPQEMKAQIIKLLDDWKGKEKEQAAPEKKAQKEK